MTGQRGVKRRAAVLTATIRMQQNISVHAQTTKRHLQARKKNVRCHLVAVGSKN